LQNIEDLLELRDNGIFGFLENLVKSFIDGIVDFDPNTVSFRNLVLDEFSSLP
jgi:hypothetical protein